MTEPAPVAVFDADTPGALAFVRSLGRAGVPVHVYGAGPLTAGRASRWCARVGRCPPPEDHARFVPWLEARVRSGEIAHVAPTSDLLAFLVSEVRDAFPEPVRSALPTAEAVRTCLFKDRFHAAVEAAGFDSPATFAPESEEAAFDLAPSLPYPLVLKPRSHVGVGLPRGVVVRSAAELRATFRAYPIPEWARRRHPELALPIAQEYVPGALEHLYSVSGVLDPGGRPVARLGAHKRSQWPPDLGVGTIFVPWGDQARMAEGERLVQTLLGRGLYELELVLDPRTGRYVAIDLNPRAHGHVRFDVARGVDLPLLWYRLERGEAAAAEAAADDGLQFLNSIPFHVGQWVGLVRGPGRRARLGRYLDIVRRPSVDIVHDRTDPLPTVVFAAKLMRHPGGLIRPFLRP